MDPAGEHCAAPRIRPEVPAEEVSFRKRRLLMPRYYWSKAAEERTLTRYRQLLDAWSVPHEETTCATSQGATFVLSCGSSQQPPVVLLHGAICNALMWLRSMRTWSQHFRVHSVDVIGDPGFSAPVRPRFAGSAHARWLEDVWDGLSLERAHLVGASLGGWFALDFASRRPQRVRHLALIGPAGIAPVRLASVLRVMTLMSLGSWGRRRALLFALGFREDELRDEDRDFFEFSLLVQSNFVGRMRVPPLFRDEQLKAITAPVTVAVGASDVLIDASATARRLERILPAAAVHRMPGGHLSLDYTDLVANALGA